MAVGAATATVLSIQGAAVGTAPLRRACDGGRPVLDRPGELAIAFASAGAAIACARALREVAATTRPPIAIRLGLAAGDVGWDVAGCTGPPIALASQLAATGAPGRIRADAVVVALAGLAEVPIELDVVETTSPPDRSMDTIGLSPREIDVLALIATGLSNRAIGRRLFISPNTAANHVGSILHKTHAANRAEAVAFAARHGLLPTPAARPAAQYAPHQPGGEADHA